MKSANPDPLTVKTIRDFIPLTKLRVLCAKKSNRARITRSAACRRYFKSPKRQCRFQNLLHEIQGY